MNRLRQSLGATVANVSQMGIGFLGLAVVSRFYPQSEIGIYFYLLGIVVVVDSVASGVFRAALKRAGEKRSDVEELTGVVALVICASTFFFLGVIFSLKLAEVVSNPFVGILIFIGTVGSRGFLMILGGTGQVAERAWIEVIRTILRVVIWVSAGMLELGLIWLGVGTFVAGGFVSILTISMIGLPSMPREETIEPIISFSRYSVPQSIVGRGFGQLTPVLIGVILGPVSVAIWTIINRIMIPSMAISSALGQVTIVRSSSKSSQGEDHSKEVSIGTHFSSVLAVPLTIGVMVVGDPVITTLFGSKYDELALLAGGIGLSKIFESQSNVLSSGIEGRDDPEKVFKIAVVAVTFGLIGIVIGGIIIGLLGIVIGTILTSMIRYLMLLRISEVRFSNGFLNQFVAGIIMGIVVLIVKNSIGISSTVWVFLHVAVGGIVYSVSLLTIDPEIWRAVEDITQRVLNVLNKTGLSD